MTMTSLCLLPNGKYIRADQIQEMWISTADLEEVHLDLVNIRFTNGSQTDFKCNSSDHAKQCMIDLALQT